VEVVAYDARWPLWFTELRARLTPYAVGLPHHVEHVGSTAVPGLAAGVEFTVEEADREVAVLTAEVGEQLRQSFAAATGSAGPGSG
jgi:GrpB-like predicted nucleotidyltransferase (UPF0157 family)